MTSASMDAREIAEAISEGINRLVWLIERDAFDDDTKADVERLVDALEAIKSPAIMTSFVPSPELFDDLRAIREHRSVTRCEA